MKRNLYVGAIFLGLLVALGVVSALLWKRPAVEAAAVQVPMFEVDPLWPKPLPNHWLIGMAIGVAERFGQAFGMRVVRAEEDVVDRHQLRELRYVLLPERIEKDAAPDRLQRVLAIELRHLLANVTEVVQKPW